MLKITIKIIYFIVEKTSCGIGQRNYCGSFPHNSTIPQLLFFGTKSQTTENQQNKNLAHRLQYYITETAMIDWEYQNTFYPNFITAKY